MYSSCHDFNALWLITIHLLGKKKQTVRTSDPVHVAKGAYSRPGHISMQHRILHTQCFHYIGCCVNPDRNLPHLMMSLPSLCTPKQSSVNISWIAVSVILVQIQRTDPPTDVMWPTSDSLFFPSSLPFSSQAVSLLLLSHVTLPLKLFLFFSSQALLVTLPK